MKHSVGDIAPEQCKPTKMTTQKTKGFKTTKRGSKQY